MKLFAVAFYVTAVLGENISLTGDIRIADDLSTTSSSGSSASSSSSRSSGASATSTTTTASLESAQKLGPTISSPRSSTITAPPKTANTDSISLFFECVKLNGDSSCTRTLADGTGTVLLDPFTIAEYIYKNNPYFTHMPYTWQESIMPVVGPICSSSWETDATMWYATAPITEAPTPTVPAFDFTATSPCCSTCTIFGGEIKVYHWPTGVLNSNMSVLYDLANDFTFRSPSIYVAFPTLSATNLCGTLGAFTDTTIAFDMSELSTRPQYHTTSGVIQQEVIGQAPQGWVTIPFSPATWGTSDNGCASVTTVFSTLITLFRTGERITTTIVTGENSGAAVNVYNIVVPDKTLTDYSTWTVSYNPCSPILSVPTKMFTLEDSWTGCVPGISGFVDPPYVLTVGGTLGAFKPATSVTVVSPVKEITSASPSPSPAPPTITATASVSLALTVLKTQCALQPVVPESSPAADLNPNADSTTSGSIAQTVLQSQCELQPVVTETSSAANRIPNADPTTTVNTVTTNPPVDDPPTNADPTTQVTNDPPVNDPPTPTVPEQAPNTTLTVSPIKPGTDSAVPGPKGSISVADEPTNDPIETDPADPPTQPQDSSSADPEITTSLTTSPSFPVPADTSSTKEPIVVQAQTHTGPSATTVGDLVLTVLPGGSSVAIGVEGEGTTTLAVSELSAHASALSGVSIGVITVSGSTSVLNLGGAIQSIGGFGGGGGSEDPSTASYEVIYGTGSPSSGIAYNGTVFTGDSVPQRRKMGLGLGCSIALGGILIGII